MIKRPRCASLRKPLVDMLPSGNAISAATDSLSGVAGSILRSAKEERGGISRPQRL